MHQAARKRIHFTSRLHGVSVDDPADHHICLVLLAALRASGSEGSEEVKVTTSDPPTLTVSQTPPHVEAGNHGNVPVETAQPDSCE